MESGTPFIDDSKYLLPLAVSVSFPLFYFFITSELRNDN